jgi:hypothetical protein
MRNIFLGLAVLLMGASAGLLGIEMVLAKPIPQESVRPILLRKGMTYGEAQKNLKKGGWKDNPEVEPDLRSSSTVQKLVNRGYREVVTCSGTGRGFCRFEWMNQKGELLVVITVPGIKDAMIEEWRIEQPAVQYQIVDGMYLHEPQTDAGLEVKGARYRYGSEYGSSIWKSVKMLKSTQKGVLFDGKQHWCLSTMLPQARSICTKTGWETVSN